jgi:hypothetical protein
MRRSHESPGTQGQLAQCVPTCAGRRLRQATRRAVLDCRMSLHLTACMTTPARAHGVALPAWTPSDERAWTGDCVRAGGALRLDLLMTFLVVADELHFTQAAKRLFLSQSGLSRRITQLEDVVGATLVLRTTRSVELTAAGLALLPYARAIVEAASAAIAAMTAASPRPAALPEIPRQA